MMRFINDANLPIWALLLLVFVSVNVGLVIGEGIMTLLIVVLG